MILWSAKTNYTALLCSRHYASFFNESIHSAEQAYYRHELERQNRLLLGVGDISDDEINIHVEILKFFDRLSIYICINEPGTSKESEFPWYRDGFQGSEQIPGTYGNRINAYWLDKNHVGLTVFPFTARFKVSVPTKIVSKRVIEQQGIAVAYKSTPVTIRTVKVGPM